MVGSTSGSTAVVVLLLIGGFTVSAFTPSLAVAASVALPPNASGSISVAATGDYGYTPDTFQQVPTNATITVTFTDESPMGAHTFTIIGKEGWVVPSSYTPDQIDNLAYGNHPPALFNLNVSSEGDVETGSFISPGPGWYEFLCTVSGHFQLGMYGFIAFGMNLPSNVTPSTRTGIGGGLAFSFVSGIIVGALLVVILLAFIFIRRRRSALRFPAQPVRQPATESGRAPENGKDRGSA